MNGGCTLKALALFSGGLDSLLAIKLIQETGVDVEAVHFLLPFLDEEAEQKVRAKLTDLAGQLNVPVHFVRLGEDYLRMLEKPKYGYGKGMNPCLDCHIFFLNKAKELLATLGASFLVTGEVVGQRPKSQHAGAFPKIDEDTGLAGWIVRPLSAGLLPKTIPEEKGWISLDHCPTIQGRQRHVQMELAHRYGLHFQPPAGGCQLTNKEFGRKVADLLQNEGKLQTAPMTLLSIGRHFRLPGGLKLVVGRDAKENWKLTRYFLRHRKDQNLLLIKVGRIPGPVALGLGASDDNDAILAARITARYCDLSSGAKVSARVLSSAECDLTPPILVDKHSGFEQSYRVG